jgi:hypothetical protein
LRILYSTSSRQGFFWHMLSSDAAEKHYWRN